MNILFLTLLSFRSLNEKNIYTDLLREFCKKGESVYVISPTEKRNKQETCLIKEEKATILSLKIGNITKTNMIEKGISTLMVEPIFKRAIEKYFGKVKFDLVLYSTPPITLVGVVKHVKKRDNAVSYLMLKDIFPQNAVDIGMMKTKGIKGVLYKYFRGKEKQLYKVSDHIGCMSKANIEYVLLHNPEIDQNKVELSPNCIEIEENVVSDKLKADLKKEYDIPTDKKIFVYGGNLGKPQCVPFIFDCIKKCKEIREAFFVIIGNGTDYSLLKKLIKNEKLKNVKLIKWLPKTEYDQLISACEVGLIFLDHRFTIPNYPSRLLGYMQAKLAVLASTDPNTDVGNTITDGGFGWQCESNDAEAFERCVKEALEADLEKKGRSAFEFMKEHFNVADQADLILSKINRQEI